MNNKRIKLVVLLGLIAICGIVAIQLHWLKEAFDFEEKKFGEKVHIALLEVVKKLYGEQEHLPQNNPINQISKDYYVVNINNDFDAEILDFYLKHEFEKFNIDTDFEYSIYDCVTDDMVYGNYIKYDDKTEPSQASYFPKSENLVYYFAVRFPGRTNYFFSHLKLWLLVSIALFVVLLIYVYSIFIILQQKRFSELQKDFINNMTHEFKTPLSSILIASNYLAKQNSISSDYRMAKYTETIITQGGRLNAHVEKILNLAKSESNPLKLEKTRFNVTEFLQNITEEVITKNPEVKIVVEKHTDYTIYADKVHFGNLVYNLLDNAIKYAEKKPEINIKLSESTDYLLLEVSDNGVGIPLKDQKMIFKKFYRVPSANPVHGFGLGLFYVKKICQQHHWKLKFSSLPGFGTNFRIIVPKSIGS